MRRIVAVSLIFLAVSVLASGAVSYDLSFRPRSYVSYDDTFGSYQFDNQLSLQAAAGLSVYLIDDIALRAELLIGKTDPTVLFASTQLRGFDSISLGLGTGMLFSDSFGFYTMLYAHYSTYTGTSVRFAHLETSFTPYYQLISDSLFDIFLDIPVSYDYRRDLDHTVSAGIGIRVAFPSGGIRP